MTKNKILLIILLVITVGALAIFTGQGENKSNKKELATAPLSVGNEITEGKEYNLENFLEIDDCYVLINGEKVNSSTVFPVEYGDLIDIHLAWSFPNSGLTLTTNDTFTYEFPSNLTFPEIENGLVRDGSQIVGYYTIHNNKVTIQYTDEDFVNQSNIIGTLNVSGEVTSDTTSGENGGRVDLEIPGVGTFPIYVEPQGSLSLNKTINKKIDTDTYEYKIEVKSEEENTEVIIGDNLGDYLHLNKDSIKIEKNGVDITDSIDILYDQISGNTSVEFIFMVDKMADNDTITVTYQADVDDKGFIWDINSNEDMYQRVANLTNLAGTVSKENPTWLYDSTTVETGKGATYKEGYYDADNNVLWWNIYVKKKKKGVTLSDYFENQEFIEGTLQVYESDINNTNPVLSPLKITFEELEDGYTFDPDPTGEKVYIIHYASKPTQAGINDGEVYNKANLYLGDEKVYDGVVIEIGVPLINKYVDGANEQDGILSWNTTITAYNNDLKNTVFKDKLGTGLSLITESVKINGIAIDDTNYKLNIVEGGFEIYFGDVQVGEIFDITYDTTFDNSGSGTFVNTAYISAEGVEASDDATYEYYKKENYITKYVNYKQSEDAYKTGIVTWQIDIDEMPEGTENAYIDDIIPEGMEYVDGSATLVLNKNPYTTYTLEPTLKDNILTFDITDYMDQIQGDNGVSIFYQSRVIDAFSEAKTYVNKAYITIDGNKYPEVSASISGEVSTLIEKEAIYNTLTAPDILYTIKVNEGALDLSEDSDTILLDDKMGRALSFIMGSLEVNGETWTDYTWDPDAKVLSITVPDSTALTITYQARVDLSVGDKLTEENAYNYVKLFGYDEESTEDENTIVGDVLESSATSSGDTKSIYVYKYKDGIMTNPMTGAEFTLIDCGYEGSGDTFKLTGEETVVDTLVTGTDGYASYSGLVYDHVYKLVETKTNSGYALDDEEYYFVYPGHDNIDYPDYISEKKDTWTFYINNNYAKTSLNVEKVWDDNNNDSRPSYITVYLKQNGNYVLDNGNKVFKVLNADNNWKATFEDLDKYDSDDNLYSYTVEEEVPTGYEVAYQYPSATNAVITNTLVKGDLTITKTVNGTAGELDRDFTFKIELFDEGNNILTGTYNYTGDKTGTITSGNTITLKHGESITINNLPLKTTYKITEIEANTDGYTTEVTNGSGTINSGNQTAEFVNTKNEEFGTLKINKTVSGTAGETDRDFTFKIELFDENNNVLAGTYNYTGDKTGTITSGDTITLKHKESITIDKLPVGTIYQITEIEANTDGYATTVTGNNGTIIKGNQTVSFINTRNETPSGSLTISKTVSGTAGEMDRDFTFKIELFDENNNILTDTYNYTGDKTGTITSGDTITLKHGESITIDKLPLGTKYQVTEIEANTDGYETTATNDNGTITEKGANVNFVNVKNETPKGSLTISKIVGGNAGELDRDFTFKIELFDESNNILTGTYNYTGDKTGTITSGDTVTLKHGESVMINDLPVGTIYKVTEIEANTDGYTTTMKNNEGTITEGNITTSFENTKVEVPVLKGFLTINKNVTGAGDKNRDFTFKVEFTDENGNSLTDTFSYAGSKVGTITSGGTFTLRHGQSITIVGLPIGTKYKVTEIEANADGYVTTSENTEGVIDANGEITSFTNYKEEEKETTKKEKTIYIPKTGVKDYTALYGLGALASIAGFVILYRRKENAS